MSLLRGLDVMSLGLLMGLREVYSMALELVGFVRLECQSIGMVLAGILEGLPMGAISKMGLNIKGSAYLAVLKCIISLGRNIYSRYMLDTLQNGIRSVYLHQHGCNQSKQRNLVLV